MYGCFEVTWFDSPHPPRRRPEEPLQRCVRMPRKGIRRPIPRRPGSLGRQRGRPVARRVSHPRRRGLAGRQPRGHEVRRLAGRATHRARALPSASPGPVSPAGSETRWSHRDLGARRVAVLRAATDQGGGDRTHADRAGSPRWSGLGGCLAAREGMPGPPEAALRSQDGSGHAAPVETAPPGTTGRDGCVSPHLKIGTPLAEVTAGAMRRAREHLEGMYEFVGRQARV